MTELVPITIQSIYKRGGEFVNLPSRMAQCTPDFKEAILHIRDDVRTAGGDLILSDLYRTYDMQYKAYMDYKTGRKTAYSPPPGGSFHEAGRAMDLSLEDLQGLGTDYLAKFWAIAAKYRVVPIISQPNPRKSEAWHFECRGEFQTVRKLQGYKQAVRAAILDIGVDIKEIEDDEAAWVQGQILSYGIDIGPIDGIIGRKTKAAIRQIKASHDWPLGSKLAEDDDAWDLPDKWLITFLDTLTVRAV